MKKERKTKWNRRRVFEFDLLLFIDTTSSIETYKPVVLISWLLLRYRNSRKEEYLNILYLIKKIFILFLYYILFSTILFILYIRMKSFLIALLFIVCLCEVDESIFEPGTIENPKENLPYNDDVMVKTLVIILILY